MAESSSFPKVDTLDTENNVTRVNSTTGSIKKEENGSAREKTETIASTVDESHLLTGNRLILVHCGFLLSILLVALGQ